MKTRALVVAAGLLVVPLGACGQMSGSGDDTGDAAMAPGAAELEALWQGAEPFPVFLQGVEARPGEWQETTAAAAAPDAILRRIGAVGGRWRILAVAADWCGDSVNNLPWVAALAAASPGLELRVISARAGRDVTGSHRTPDGRRATPTFLLLDEEGRDRGCFVERPPELQEWFLAVRDTLPEDELVRQIHAWYDEDAGLASMEEIATMIEAAGRGERRCVGVDDEGSGA